MTDPSTRKPPGTATQLRRLGFQDANRAEQLSNDPALRQLTSHSTPGVTKIADGTHSSEAGTDAFCTDVLSDIGSTADPDRALLALVRLATAAQDDDLATTALKETLANPEARRRLLAVLGASTALGDELVRHPATVAVFYHHHALPRETDPPNSHYRTALLHAVGADPHRPNPVARNATSATIDQLRAAYRATLLQITATDLTAANPTDIVDDVWRALADLAAAALEAALAIAWAEHDDATGVRFTIIGMGKCGGRELNYVSDVDVIYVVEPETGTDEAHALQIGAQLATGVYRACSVPSGQPALWPVDTALRPEGANGPLVRTLASHRIYYERWAKTWEFQALLRARPIAGDMALGTAYLDAITPLVWQASHTENFVTDAQSMRRRVEQHIPAAEADRELKLGSGGLRDIEFTVQLLQLVHGRSDRTLRSPHTLNALTALADAGYVGRDDADRMAVHYRLLRVVEHRMQLNRLRRTHLLPTAMDDLRRLGRSIGVRADPAQQILTQVRTTQREVRALHEALFYRPLLPEVAQLSAENIVMSPQAVATRLAALGYRNPAGALRHMQALTGGASRTAAIHRQLLPAMLGWFAQGADPDVGLLGFRTLSDDLGRTPWYLKLLRDSALAAPRLAHVLSSSPYLVQALGRSPESIQWLADDSQLAPSSATALRTEVAATVARHPDGTGATLLRAIRRRELARTATGELLHLSDPVAAAEAITTVTDEVLVGTLSIAERLTLAEFGCHEPPTRVLIVAMGRLGGCEPGYGSDADVIFVHEPHECSDLEVATAYATAVATTFRTLLGHTSGEPALEVDADLRPEGRHGPLVRTLDSYREYYNRWAQNWENQALLRARPVAGDPGLAACFTTLIEPLRYPTKLTTTAATDIRRIKARVERERLPRAVQPERHLKLGPGAIGDVEWTVQLLQLEHAHEHQPVQTTATLPALTHLNTLGFITDSDRNTLQTAWLLASGIRNALTLWTGRTSGPVLDVLPAERKALSGLALIMNYPVHAGMQLEEDYLRAVRRSRRVVERLFYGKPVTAADGS